MKKILLTIIAAGVIFAQLAGHTGGEKTTQPTARPMARPIGIQEPIRLAAVEIPSDTRENTHREAAQLLDAPLDAETQWSIYTECGCDKTLFCMVMAIAAQETGFDTDAVGDGGNSIGLMQINTQWHTERMESLGITDLTDPVQNARVAIDILRELETRYGAGIGTHRIAIYYNVGPSGGAKIIKSGAETTNYSRAVIKIFDEYMAQMGGS